MTCTTCTTPITSGIFCAACDQDMTERMEAAAVVVVGKKTTKRPARQG